DFGAAIAVDGSGNVYVTGTASSTDFPTRNPIQAANRGGTYDIFVTELTADGKSLVYSTYLGGSGTELPRAIAVTSTGNAFVTGETNSTNFPTKNPLQPTYGGGSNDAFVAEIQDLGAGLVYSTYLGGALDDRGFGIAVDRLGNAYVTGS